MSMEGGGAGPGKIAAGRHFIRDALNIVQRVSNRSPDRYLLHARL